VSNVAIPWYEDFLGVAYRYYDLRMNVVPLFSNRKQATDLWNETVHWWSDHDIKLRFVETGDKYWFIMASESRRPDHNRSFFKILQKSNNYERFKKGHMGEAYLRFGVFAQKEEKDVKDDAVCNCGHTKEDHDGECQIEQCECRKFESFIVNLLKKKKTITDIKFLEEKDVKDDAVSWNCLYINKYKNTA
jgi:hypothetical protein